MNCKPGDLAVLVNDDAGMESNIGAFVRVLDEELSEPGEWRCICEYRELLCFDECTLRIEPLPRGEAGWFMDSHLRPIRPGDISDEEVRDLYAPKQPEQAATRKPVHGGYPEHV